MAAYVHTVGIMAIRIKDNTYPGKLVHTMDNSVIQCIISYLGMQSWDLLVCDRASTIKRVDREKKNSANYSNEIFYFFVG